MNKYNSKKSTTRFFSEHNHIIALNLLTKADLFSSFKSACLKLRCFNILISPPRKIIYPLSMANLKARKSIFHNSNAASQGEPKGEGE